MADVKHDVPRQGQTDTKWTETDPKTGATGHPALHPQGKGNPDPIDEYRKASPIPDNPWMGKLGLRIRLTRVEGLTAPHILQIPFIFQIPPLERFARSLSFEHNDWMALRLGQFDRPTGYNLQKIQFDTMFLDYDVGWAVLYPLANTESGKTIGWHPNSRKMCETLIDIMHAGTPFQFEAFHHPDFWREPSPSGNSAIDPPLNPVWEVRMKLATLRELEIEERAGEPDARYATCTFVESRRPEILRKRKGDKTPATITINYDPKDPNNNGWVDIPTWPPEKTPLTPKHGAPPGIHCKPKDPDHPDDDPLYHPEYCRSNPSLKWLAKHYYGSSARWRVIRDYKPNAKWLKGIGGDTPIGDVAIKFKRTIKLTVPPVREKARGTRNTKTTDPKHPGSHH